MRVNPWRVASASVLGVTLMLFAVWWLLLRAPTPAEVCDHIVQVTVREASDQAMSEASQQRLVETTMEQCIQHKQDKLLLRGRMKYAAYAKCVMAADDLIGIGRC
ncbi:MAG: hypothetical protein AB1Z98_31695 [Nannocystaceae bacterium]